MKKRPTFVGLFSFGGPCPREGRGIPFPYLAHAGAGGSCHSPCGLTGSPGSGTPARRRRIPAPQPPAMRAKGPSLLGPLRAALRLPPRRAGGERLGQGPDRGRRRAPRLPTAPARTPQAARGWRRLRRAARAEAEPGQQGQRRRRGRAARLAGAPPTGPEGRTAPQPPHSGGRAAPEHLRRSRRGGGAKQGRTKCARLRAWPCFAERCPRATGAANLTGPGLPGLGRHITPTAAGGRGGRRPAAQGGQGSGPQAAGGGRDGPKGRTGAPTTARRRWPLFPLPAAAASDGGRVWGVTQQRTAAGAAEHSSAGPSMVGPGLMCGR
jgi:hypothetical protein